MKRISFFLLLGLSTFTFATKEPHTKYIMRDVFNSFRQLVPYMSSEMKFRDPKNETEVMSALVSLDAAFLNAHKNKKLTSYGYKPTLEVIREHIGDTKNAFMGHHKIFAFNRLKSTTSLCISCHSQLSSKGKGTFNSLLYRYDEKSFDSTYDFATFLLVTRNYEASLKQFEKCIDEEIVKFKKMRELDPKINMTPKLLINSLKKIVIIYTKILGQPEKLTIALKKYQSQNGLSRFVKSDIEDWIAQIGDLKKEGIVGKTFDTKKQINSLLHGYLAKRGKAQDVRMTGELDLGILVASGHLLRYLDGHSRAPEAPEMLYWISMGERQLSRNYFYDLSELYLKECIEKFPKTSFGKKCFKEYEETMIFGFTGSRGTDIPPAEQKELDRLKALVK